MMLHTGLEITLIGFDRNADWADEADKRGFLTLTRPDIS